MQIDLYDGSLDEAARLLAVEAACWNESPLDAQGAQALLTDNDDEFAQACWLAKAGDEVVGFLHAFSTYRPEELVWEVDLLAVHPEWRRRGIASQLVGRATHSMPPETKRGRALVAVQNTGSAKAFERAGFTTDDNVHGILVRDVPNAPAPTIPLEVTIEKVNNRTWRATTGGVTIRLMEVRTLLYNGLWGESVSGTVTEQLLDAGLTFASSREGEEFGMVVARSDKAVLKTLLASRFDDLGDYLVWTVT